MFQILNGRPRFYQWDIGQKLLVNVDCEEVHLTNDGVTSVTSTVYEFEGKRVVDVDNEFLQTARPITAYAFVQNKDEGCTTCRKSFRVLPRPKPADYSLEISDVTQTYILIDDDGNELVGVLVGEETVFTATPDDIRLGAVAATEEGVTVGEKVIPSYHTLEGYRLIPGGSRCTIPLSQSDGYDFTKLQAIICSYAGSISGSVAAEKVAINESVYPVNSTELLSTVVKDHESKSVDLGISNESESPCLIRYFTYKETV